MKKCPSSLLAGSGLAILLGLLLCIRAGSARGDGPGNKAVPDLGVDASLNGKQVFPADDAWNQDISAAPVDPNSTKLIASIGNNVGLHPDFGTTYNNLPNGIPYVIVPGNQAKVPIIFGDYGDESDKGPYPIPPDVLIEGGPKSDGDRHVLILDRDNWMLYELWHATAQDGGKSWKADSGAIFDLKKASAQRKPGITSADAAGLPIFPGLVRYDEVVQRKAINHALRFTIQHSRHAYVLPALHFASNKNSPDLPPMGMRVRLKAGYDISPFPAEAQVILAALKKYGMIVADNGGNWFISGAPDPRWNDDNVQTLRRVKGTDFEVIKMENVVTK